ncbi:hypothetical protein O9K51_04646 [Purpureocillium lavendulum]|uniref:Uncharacterized protein n=1 Tax=Purpureocillium lavendulum TaxID=1247861 RepID=A0AB34FWF1_9HYPO|nr:hypothetical protein O9K51_04646 [Purpureocillium lavendulum]
MHAFQTMLAFLVVVVAAGIAPTNPPRPSYLHVLNNCTVGFSGRSRLVGRGPQEWETWSIGAGETMSDPVVDSRAWKDFELALDLADSRAMGVPTEQLDFSYRLKKMPGFSRRKKNQGDGLVIEFSVSSPIPRTPVRLLTGQNIHYGPASDDCPTIAVDGRRNGSPADILYLEQCVAPAEDIFLVLCAAECVTGACPEPFDEDPDDYEPVYES